MLETSHPPAYYIGLDDVAPGVLEPSPGRTTVCEWKGTASYYDVVAGGQSAERAAWTYHDPFSGFEAIRDAVAVYPALMDACWVDEERVEPQPGGFYGGWITSDVLGLAESTRGRLR